MPGPDVTSGNIQLVDIENDAPNSNYNPSVGGIINYITLPSLTVGEDNIVVEDEVFTLNFPEGGSLFSFPFDSSTITKIEYIKNYDASNILHTVNNPSMLLQVYHHHMQSGKFAIFSKGAGDTRTEAEFISDTRPGPHQGIAYESDTNHAPSLEDLFAGPLADTSYNQYGNVIIMKDYFGAAFLPQYNFNGIGSICKYEGLQIKAWQPFQLRFHPKCLCLYQQ